MMIYLEPTIRITWFWYH